MDCLQVVCFPATTQKLVGVLAALNYVCMCAQGAIRSRAAIRRREVTLLVYHSRLVRLVQEEACVHGESQTDAVPLPFSLSLSLWVRWCSVVGAAGTLTIRQHRSAHLLVLFCDLHYHLKTFFRQL